MMKFKILLYLLIISIVFSESGHVHNHSHENVKKKYAEVRDLIFDKITDLKDRLGDI